MEKIKSIGTIEEGYELTKELENIENLINDYSINPQDKFNILLKYIDSYQMEVMEFIYKQRDSIPFLRGMDLRNTISVLCSIVSCEKISDHERHTTAVCLYNNCFIDHCYICFSILAQDKSVSFNYRTDAARYLYISEDHDNKQLAQECLLEIVENFYISSEERYKIIASFISMTGINTMMNMKKIRVQYDEDFVYCLQSSFFFNEKNDVKFRILSGQHLLQMKTLDEEERETIVDSMLEIAENKSLSENTRADASDVLMRVGTKRGIINARELISEIGGGKVKDIYQNSQNIHEFQDQIDDFIEKIIKERDFNIDTFEVAHKEVSNKIRDILGNDAESKLKSYKALDRISLDTARFTKYNFTLSEIFIHVWGKIKNSEPHVRQELEKRMVEELADMGETCSSGHSGRFVNILSSYDHNLKISWEDQIKSNVNGRMNAMIRDSKKDISSSITLSDKKRKVLLSFLAKVKKELYEEFVGEGHTYEQIFEKAFEEAEKYWLEN